MTTTESSQAATSTERRVDLLYNAKWRSTLLVTLPFGVIAFLTAWLLEEPSNQATTLDAIMYPILAAALVVLEIVLLASHRALRPVLLIITAGVSIFFASKLAWILFLLPANANVQAEMTENFFWIPSIYLLSFILPGARLGKRITLAFTIAVLILGIIYSVPNVIQDQNWGVTYALIQMNLANCVFFALTSAFTHLKDEHTRAHTRLETVERYAYTDHLTGLPNRHKLQHHLESRLAHPDQSGTRFAVLFVDVDGFKVVNDSLGHAGGDRLLKQVARRVQSTVRDEDFIARISGDEFVLVINGAETHDTATVAAQRVLATLTEPFHVQGHALRVSASIGISLYPDDAQDADTLLKHADSAMYRVKRAGRNGVQHFLGAPDEELEKQRLLERDLREALENRELSLAYQSLHDLASGEVQGFEALLRWHHPRWGHVPPSDFIPLAEQSGLIVPIGTWVLNEACRQAKEWQSSGWGAFRVAVNVSPMQFSHPDFFDTVLAALETHGLSSEYLELELTESIVMQEVKSVAATLARLQRLGIRIAIDDFGTGYSSLAYLRDLPINSVKIDRSFIRDVASSASGAPFALALIEAIVTLASHLELEVVTEGIETDAQCKLVRGLGCSVGQGFFFSRPLAPRDLESFLAGRASGSSSA